MGLKQKIPHYCTATYHKGKIIFYIYIKLKVSLSSAIEIKLKTFRYKQKYETNITIFREAKYGILISIRIVYGGIRAYGALLEAYLYCCTMK